MFEVVDKGYEEAVLSMFKNAKHPMAVHTVAKKLGLSRGRVMYICTNDTRIHKVIDPMVCGSGKFKNSVNIFTYSTQAPSM